MRIKELFDFIIEEGINEDPRGKEAVMKELSLKKAQYDTLPKEEKERFDKESLTNPYIDSRILSIGDNPDIKGILVGIDIDTAELLLAERLKEKGKRIDMVLSHHPAGRSYVNFYEVMYMQSEILSRFGVPINVAEDLLQKRKEEVERKVMPANHFKTTDAANLLDIPFMNAHTPADNHVATFLQKIFDRESPLFVKDIIDMLCSIPEYKRALHDGNGPKIVIGDKKRKAGKVFVDMTGGTEGSAEIFKNLSNAGIGTIVGMHFSQQHCNNAKDSHINVVIAGHMASDSLGLNLLLAKVRKKFSALQVIPCSGFYWQER